MLSLASAVEPYLLSLLLPVSYIYIQSHLLMYPSMHLVAFYLIDMLIFSRLYIYPCQIFLELSNIKKYNRRPILYVASKFCVCVLKDRHHYWARRD